ncbi:hypothetical protein BJX66DRAFT_340553 [Aspergillus keveii]|uniref:Fungal STAND N-terminal Goodbye domain-containing protein n=1 Tax=Aspergillus keveii TaxID=714993 RepID=A0ABR4FY12_9EURO
MEALSLTHDLDVGTDAEVDPAVADAWRHMRERLQELEALSNGQKYDPNLQPEGVLASLDRIQNQGGKRSPRWDKVKEIFSGTLNVIQTVGGLVADAASQVFAPASQCYNAINFVIGAWQEYQSVFDVLTDLFAECTKFLSRLREYVEGGMDKAMSNITCRALQHFVEICERAVMLRTSRRFKTMTIIRIAFLSKNEFRDLMDGMNRITKEEIEQATARIYRNTQESTGLVKMSHKLLEDEAGERALDRQETKDKTHLLDTLAFDRNSSSWDNSQGEPNPTWRTTYQNIRQQQVPGTGERLFSNLAFTAWKDNGNPPVLGIVGGESSGKSYLVSSVIHHLRSAESTKARSSRRLVAFYFVNSKKGDPCVIDDLAKSIIWQFADSDASYLQSAAMACKRRGTIDPKDLLAALLLDIEEELEKVDATFYIVINKLGGSEDYVDAMLVSFLQRVLQSRRKSVRVLFTATEATMGKLTQKKISCSAISMKLNTDDISKYIESRLDRIDILSDLDDSDVAQARRKIHSKLLATSEGNYYTINTLLSEIRNLDYVEQMVEVLDGPRDNLGDRIDKDIRRLEQSRTIHELQEINTIILWIMFAREQLTADKMKAVLRFAVDAISLRPLEERLSQKFLLFEINNEGYVGFRSEQIISKIPGRGRNGSDRRKDDTAVQESEVAVVKHFLKTVCPPQLMQKLELEDHFHSKLQGEQQKIYQEDSNTAHFKLAQACLKVLARDHSDSLKVLRGYAARNVIFHMSETQLKLIDREMQGQVGLDLVSLFRDGRAIDNLFWAQKEIPHLPKWLFLQETAEMVIWWLKTTSPPVENDEDGRWLRELLASEGNKDKMIITLVEPSIVRMAENCFRMEASRQNAIASFQIVREFLSTFNLIPSDIDNDHIEAWCSQKLHVARPDSLWHTQMACVLWRSREKAASQARCREALKIDEHNWRASFLLALSLNNDVEGKRILKHLIHHYRHDAAWMKENKSYFAEMIYRLGRWYWKDDQPEKALEQYIAFAGQETDQHMFYLDILASLYSKEDWESMAVIIGKLRSSSNLVPMAITMEAERRNEEFDLILLQLVIHTRDHQILDDVYQAAIAISAKAKNHRASFHFRRAYTRALYAKSPVPLDEVTTLLEAAAGDVPYTGMNLEETFFRVGYKLGTIYLNHAKQAKDAEGAKPWLRRMAAIVPEQVSEAQMRLPLSLFAARYHHKVRGDDDAARRETHNTLKMAVELLADGDASNDMLAYSKIIHAVTPFGDVEHARTAAYLMKLESPPGTFKVSCSCKCNFESDDPGDMWRCMDCINVTLTSKCRERVMDRTLGYVCHPDHEHFNIRRWNGERKGDKVVPWKDGAITMEDWRSKLIRKYHLK